MDLVVGGPAYFGNGRTVNPQPKPTPRAWTRAQARRRRALARKACVAAVWQRENGCCERCGVCVNPPQVAAWFAAVGHVHERVSRAQGGDPTDPANCELLCYNCHYSGPSGAHVRSDR